MIQKTKLIIIFTAAVILGWLAFGSSTVHASGEKWELVDSSTIRVSGGSFTGPLAGNGFTINNPRSIDLKLKTAPNTDPSIWQANSSFNLGVNNNGQASYLEDKPREVGEFCVVVNNFALLKDNREAATFQPIHREDCNKSFSEMRFITSGNSEYNRCGNWAFVQGTRCNTMWASSQTGSLSLDTKIAYNIPSNKPPVCGDPNFVGPCPQTSDPAKADCSKTDGSAGAGRKCEAIKACIVDAGKKADECSKAWTECTASYGTKEADINFNACQAAIAKGDFEGGKKQVGNPEPENKTSCAVEGVGWIVCPLAGFLGMMTDGLFGVLTTLLSFTPLRDNEETYNTWQAMRNIANAAFVIAFLVIIFSQLTGAGITNYGIKKMIPRLIVAAVLVNVSFFICQIAVDLSNILGYSLQSLMTNASKTVSGESNSLDVWGDLVGWILAGGIGAATGIPIALSIAAAGGWVPALALLLPVLVTVLFAVLTVVLVLAARQALIIILVVISPLAFVAYLLPNTEDWFHKWRKLFITLLLMFPIISVIFGGSQLAAAIIRAGTNNPLIYILSLAVQVIPFFLVPIIMKTAGGLLNRFGGIVNNPNRGPFDKLRKRAEGYAGYRVNNANAANLKRAAEMDPKKRSNRFSFVGRARRNAERNSIYSSAESRAKEAGVEYIGNQLSPNDSGDPNNFKFATKMAGSNDLNAIMQASARGASAVDEIEAKELKAGHVLLSNAQVDQKGLSNLLEGRDAVGMNGTIVKATSATTMAAASLMGGQGRAMDVVAKTLATSSDERMQRFAVTLLQQNYPKAKEKQIGLTSESLLKDIAGGKFAGNKAAFNAAYESATAEKLVSVTVDNMATQEKSSLEAGEKGRSSLTAAEVAKIHTTADAVVKTPSARAKTNDDTFAIISRL